MEIPRVLKGFGEIILVCKVIEIYIAFENFLIVTYNFSLRWDG